MGSLHCKSLKIYELYLQIMQIFVWDGKDTTVTVKKTDACLGNALSKTVSQFQGLRLLSITPVKAPTILSCCIRRKCAMPVRITTLQTGNPQLPVRLEVSCYPNSCALLKLVMVLYVFLQGSIRTTSASPARRWCSEFTRFPRSRGN